MQKFIFIFLSFIIISCSNINDLGNTREFEFIYKVNLDKTNQKVEVWIPIPQTNEVQTISNEILNSDELICEKLIESKHGNYYYYCSSDNGLKHNIVLTYKCNVKKK